MLDKVKDFTRRVFTAAQKVLLPALLFAAYFLVVGPMALTAALFRLLPRREAGRKSYWEPIAAPADIAADAAEQS